MTMNHPVRGTGDVTRYFKEIQGSSDEEECEGHSAIRSRGGQIGKSVSGQEIKKETE